MNNQNIKAWLRVGLLPIALGSLIFVTAWTINYWQAWVYIVVSFVSIFLNSLYLVRKDPALLKRRMNVGPRAEKEKSQKIIMSLNMITPITLNVIPALDHRFMWSNVPPIVSIAGDILVAVSFYIFYIVYKENPFSAATIQVEKNQKVVSTGLYGFVRHPMYAGTVLVSVATPLALGSYWGLLAFLAMMPVLIWRLLDEEKFLAKNLPGYSEYLKKVRWRLIPGIF